MRKPLAQKGSACVMGTGMGHCRSQDAEAENKQGGLRSRVKELGLCSGEKPAKLVLGVIHGLRFGRSISGLDDEPKWSETWKRGDPAGGRKSRNRGAHVQFLSESYSYPEFQLGEEKGLIEPPLLG